MAGKHRRTTARRRLVLVVGGLLAIGALSSGLVLWLGGDDPPAPAARGLDSAATASSDPLAGEGVAGDAPDRAATDGEAAPAPVGDTAAPGRAVDSLDWDALAQCLSSGDPEAVSADQQHHGLYQFSVEVWESVGGSGLPSEAPPAEQLERAKALYEKFGPGQWPTCANHL